MAQKPYTTLGNIQYSFSKIRRR